MATIVFGALGTLVGGPLGGAIGSLIGRELDSRILAPRREGPRLKELAVTSSSYGQPIARLFGTTRAAGTIVWSTDLIEHSASGGGGKGRPKTTEYSYSVSLAVALSSRPITGVGRIWADGNLLRGAAGDLKTGGTLRVHEGHADQEPDPLLAAALGDQCPAHRGLAYVVFEDLALADFGNRIPALSFEVFADGAGSDLPGAVLGSLDAPLTVEAIPEAALLDGFVHEGGAVADALAAVTSLAPATLALASGALHLAPESQGPGTRLPPAIAWPDGEFGTRTGRRASRIAPRATSALRYYDSGRDFQPGLQRAIGMAPSAGEQVLELPVTLSADAARGLVEALRLRRAVSQDRTRLRVASLDPALAPGRAVAVAGGELWRVETWEWREGGVELDLLRLHGAAPAVRPSDGGTPWRPADRRPAPTLLDGFELPWDGQGESAMARVRVAASAGDGLWAGAALYAVRGGALVDLGRTKAARAITGRLTTPLPSSPALLFEGGAAIELACDWSEAVFESVSAEALASGANRLLVGGEVVQFGEAERLGPNAWRLAGLLRGRGGTEAEAALGHLSGTRIILLDDRLTVLDSPTFDPIGEPLAAIGLGDAAPTYAAVSDPGRSRRPLVPVHPSVTVLADGGLRLEWTRRARGAWQWLDGVEVPLVEESESYEVGAGPSEAPLRLWTTSAPNLDLQAGDLSPLPDGTPFWVRQIGSFARSSALHLHAV